MENKQLGIRQFISHVATLFKKNLVDTEIISESLQILLQSVEDPLPNKILMHSKKKSNSTPHKSPSTLPTKKKPGRPPKRSAEKQLSVQVKRPRRSVTKRLLKD